MTSTIRTYTGADVDPWGPSGRIAIEDIAHSLAMQCRFGGHTDQFYSVAEHCVRASYLVPPGHRLAALLHDASEAYLLDVPRPLKARMIVYQEAEDRLMRRISRQFGFLWPMSAEVRAADELMLQQEARNFMGAPGVHALIEPMPPLKAEVEFLFRFNALQRFATSSSSGY